MARLMTFQEAAQLAKDRGHVCRVVGNPTRTERTYICQHVGCAASFTEYNPGDGPIEAVPANNSALKYNCPWRAGGRSRL